jgi:putative molybdopterin biosynthesis protein
MNNLDLNFKYITDEDYDFLISYNMLQDNKITEFIETLKSEEFRNRVEVLGGYGFRETGNIIIIE